MTIDDLKVQQLRAEGFSEGFKMGYAAALDYVAKELEKEQKPIVSKP